MSIHASFGWLDKKIITFADESFELSSEAFKLKSCCAKLPSRESTTYKKAVTKTGVSTRRFGPPFVVAELLEEAQRGNGLAWDGKDKRVSTYRPKG